MHHKAKALKSFLRRRRSAADYSPVHYSYFLQHTHEFGVKHKLLSNNVLQLRKGNDVQNVYLGAYLDFDGRASLMIASDKVLCSTMLHEAGIPVPRHTVLRSGDYRSALAFKREIDGPIVIKPARYTGDGTAVFITPESSSSIWYAAYCSALYGDEMVVEEFFEGANYRLLYCRDRFLSACARIPSHVVGDGNRTIQELITLKNRGRLKQGHYLPYSPESRPILYEIVISPDLKRVIRKQGYKLNSVPDKGCRVLLQDVCHWFLGGHYEDVTDIISPELVDAGRRAVQVLGIKFAGVDLIARDITRAEPGTYVINEVNTSPALLIHYEVQNQSKLRPVAKEILRMMFGQE
jgi:cyanophycin synthetase